MKEVGAKVAQFMGYSYLKPEQEQIINGILSKCNVFEIPLTEFGKPVPFVTPSRSLCYASLPLIL